MIIVNNISKNVYIDNNNNEVYNTFSNNNIIYIDPSAGSGGNGSLLNPYNSFSGLTITDNTIYKLKKGTTLSGSTTIDLSNRSGVTLSSYGSGNKPKYILTSAQTCAIRFALSTYCTLNDWDVSVQTNGLSGLTYKVLSLVQMGVNTLMNGGTGNTISDCVLHHCYGGPYPFSGYDYGYGMAIRGGGLDLTIKNTEMYDLAVDGIYLKDTENLDISYCNIHDMCRNYQWSTTQTNASGDAIQLDGNYKNFHVHNNILNRSDDITGNKYCMITGKAESYGNTDSGIIEYNTFKTNTKVPAGLHIEFGLGVIVRYNIFEGITQGIRLGGLYSVNTNIYCNLFYNCTGGIGVGYSYAGSGYVTTGGATGTTVYNNVFYNLSAYNSSNGGGCIWLDKSHVVCQNNIFCMTGNTGIAIYSYGGSGWQISNNCYDVYASAGSIGTGTTSVVANPLFIDSLNHNFRLQSNSPCINAGIDVGILKDYDKVSIPQNTYPDIGAFEKIIT